MVNLELIMVRPGWSLLGICPVWIMVRKLNAKHTISCLRQSSGSSCEGAKFESLALLMASQDHSWRPDGERPTETHFAVNETSPCNTLKSQYRLRSAYVDIVQCSLWLKRGRSTNICTLNWQGHVHCLRQLLLSSTLPGAI